MSPRPRVLIVDDDRDNREMVAEWLRDRFVVTLAIDGAEALDIMVKRCQTFDALVVDLEMPRLNGPDLIKELRGRALDVPVLIVSGALDVRERAKEIDVDYIIKPFDLERLENELDRLVGERA